MSDGNFVVPLLQKNPRCDHFGTTAVPEPLSQLCFDKEMENCGTGELLHLSEMVQALTTVPKNQAAAPHRALTLRLQTAWEHLLSWQSLLFFFFLSHLTAQTDNIFIKRRSSLKKIFFTTELQKGEEKKSCFYDNKNMP